MAEKEADGQTKEHSTLFFYVLLATGLAFWTRAMPTPFLPLVMSRDFHQTPAHVGFAMSVYPLGAFVATPCAAAQAQRSSQILRLHSWTLMFMALSSLLLALSHQVHDFAGPDAVFVALLVCRFTQGISQAYYMAANTTLISRSFTAVAYTVAMAEVAVGSGAQLGRLAGGLLFDLGGFGCPFLVASVALSLCALVGVMFEDDVQEDEEVCRGEDPEDKQDSWKAFFTLRIFVTVAGVFSAYMVTGLMDSTLPQHLEAHLGPLSVSAVSAISSVRSLTYLLVSWQCAQILRLELLSLEALQSAGFGLVTLGLILVAPQHFVVDTESLLPSGDLANAWACQILALVLTSTGNAMLFVPGLPLLQAEVRHLGPAASERVSSLLMAAMSGGEFLGPIAGGGLEERCGFRESSALFAAGLAPGVPMGLVAFFGPQSSRSRDQPLLERQFSYTEESIDLAKNLTVPFDPESAYRFRRLAFLGPEVRRRVHSAPAQERRAFVPRLPGSSTAPSAIFRRIFLPQAKAARAPLPPIPEARRASSYGHSGPGETMAKITVLPDSESLGIVDVQQLMEDRGPLPSTR
eukprot:s4736_g6.t2